MSYRYWRGHRSWLTVEHLKVGALARTVAHVDDHYRLLLTSIAVPSVKAADVVQAFLSASDSFSLPASFLSDNAVVFSGRSRRKVVLEARPKTPTELTRRGG